MTLERLLDSFVTPKYRSLFINRNHPHIYDQPSAAGNATLASGSMSIFTPDPPWNLTRQKTAQVLPAPVLFIATTRDKAHVAAGTEPALRYVFLRSLVRVDAAGRSPYFESHQNSPSSKRAHARR